MDFVSGVLGTIYAKKGREGVFVVDSTDISVDLNWFRRRIRKADLEELKRRRIARNGDMVIFDRGYYSYDNYFMGVSRFKVIPVIFTKKTFKTEKLLGKLSYPLSVFSISNKEVEKTFFNRLAMSLKTKLEKCEVYRQIRGMIEDIFKLAKSAFGLKQLHRYTER